MTTIDPANDVVETAELVPAQLASRWERFESLLERVGDHLNPILVKEARQALRSRQFLITFFLMLAAGWLWSIIGLASIGPAVYFSAEGPRMLFVYHMFLSFPLLVVAPYSAFHSLSSERQDRTYELLSITSLGARQILSGKMCAIGLQMVVYLSAIFPCLAFTYLLRGLDIFTIVLVVAYTCALSLALSVSGLLLGAVAPLRQRHITASVLLAIVLFGALWADNMWTAGIVFQGGPGAWTEFWLVQAAVATLFVNYIAVTFLAARSQLLTLSENRSTALRWALIVVQLSFVAWMVGFQMAGAPADFVFGLIYFSAVGWFVFGMFLTGESAALSPRVRRDLPQSVLGRTFLTWFMPGPGTGYMFVIANMLVVSLLALLPYNEIGVFFQSLAGTNPATSAGMAGTFAFVRTPPAGPNPYEVALAGIVATSYLTIFLGLGTLIVRGMRRFTPIRLAVPVLVNLCLIAVGCITPWVIQMSSPTMRRAGWNLLQIPNAVWTLTEVCFERLPVDGTALALALTAMALIVWSLNLLPLLDELKQGRVAKPARVEEEDAALATAAAGDPGPKSPWDDGDGESS